MKNYKYTLLFLCLYSLISCTHRQEKLVFVPLKMFNTSDTVSANNKYSHKSQYFVIKNYSKNSRNKEAVDDFVKKIKEPDCLRFSQYELLFYKESDQTNLDNLTKNPRVMDRYSQDNDLVLTYTWINGKFISRKTYENGLPERSDDIKVQDVLK